MTTEIMADEFKIAYPLTYDESYQRGRRDAVNDAIKYFREHYAEIRKQTLKEVESAMYHEAFEVDHDEDGMQKWDGGNWIRYKLFEKVMEQMKEVRNSN